MEYWERRQELADRCACEGALCTARRSPAIPYRCTAFLGETLPTTPSNNFIASKMTRHITRRETIVREREADGTLAV